MSDQPGTTTSRAARRRRSLARRTALGRPARRGSAPSSPPRSRGPPMAPAHDTAHRAHAARGSARRRQPRTRASGARDRRLVPGGRVAARQLLPHRGAGPARQGGPARPTTASSCRGLSRASIATSRASTRRCSTLIAHTDSRLDEEYLLRFVDGYQETSRRSRSARSGPSRSCCASGWSRTCAGSRAPSSPSMRAETRRRLAGPSASCSRPKTTPADALPRSSAASMPRPSGMPPAFFVRLTQRLGELETRRRGRQRVARAPALGRGHRARGQPRSTRSRSRRPTRSRSPTRSRASGCSTRWTGASSSSGSASPRRCCARTPSQTYAVMDFGSRDRYRHALELIARRSPARRDRRRREGRRAGARGAVARRVRRGARARRLVADRPRVATSSSRSSATARLTRERLYRGPLRQQRRCCTGAHSPCSTALLVTRARDLRRVRGRRRRGRWSCCCSSASSRSPSSRSWWSTGSRRSSSRRASCPSSTPAETVDDSAPHAGGHPRAAVLGRAARAAVIEHLEITYLANRDPNVAFGLLGDVRASDRADAARRRRRSSRPRSAASPSSTSATRPSTACARSTCSFASAGFNESEGVWMGWERKRGALTELVREMRGDTDTSFVDQARRGGVPTLVRLRHHARTPTRSCRATARASSSRRSRIRSTARGGARASRGSRRATA